MRRGCVLLLTLLASVSRAEAPLAPAALPNCQVCHGLHGVSLAPDVPNLAGQKGAYLVRQLQAFQRGERRNELMNAIAAQLSAEDIQQLAAFWSAQPAVPAESAGVRALDSAMQLPADFPKGFHEYTREQSGQTVTVRYANAVAWRAAREGQPLPDGAVLISSTHAAELGADGQPLSDPQGRWRLGALRGYSGMEARAGWGDAIPPLLRNGNWQYGQWTAQGQARLNGLHARCLACHQPRAADSYVFTLPQLRAAAQH